MLILNRLLRRLYQGKGHKPLSRYCKIDGSRKKLAGWTNITSEDAITTFNTTYDDTADVVVKGKTLQKSEWVHKQGLTTQQTWTGKNLSDWELGTINIIGSEIGEKVDSLTRARCDVELKTSETVCVNIPFTRFRNAAVFQNGVLVGNYLNLTITKGTDYIIITAPYDCTMRIVISNTDDNTNIDINQINSMVQIEKGTVPTTYEPYTGGIPAPNPGFHQPLISNLPAGTYKVKDYKNDWWEFTLTDDLCGIGEVKDAVEWDKYSHKGYLRKSYYTLVLDGVTEGKKFNGYYANKRAQLYGITPAATAYTSLDALCSHFSYNTNVYSDGGNTLGFITTPTTLYIRFSSDSEISTMTAANEFLSSQHTSGNPVIVSYRTATPTFTPLTYTLNNNSTAPECPMEFLTDTPSGEYPAEVFDAGGSVISAKKPEIYSVPNGTADSFDDETLEFTNRVKRYVLTSEDIYSIVPYTNIDYIAIEKQEDSIFYGKALSYIGVLNINNLPTIYPPEINSASNIGYIINGANLYYSYIGVSKGSYTITQAKTALEGTVIYYQLATPLAINPPYTGYSDSETATIETLRSNADGTVYDEQNVTTGAVTRRMSDWEDLRNKNWALFNSYIDYKGVVSYNATPTKSAVSGVVLKHTTEKLTPLPVVSGGIDAFRFSSNLYPVIYVSNADSGWSDAYSPAANEVKAYFYGWKMCHSDGKSPYYKSEVPYNPTTWEEWVNYSGTIIKDATGITFGDGVNISTVIKDTNIKPSTKYGYLFNVVSLQGGSRVILAGGGIAYPFGNVSPYHQLGNNKHIVTSQSSFTTNKLIIGTSSPTVLKLKDIRLYELPSGSQIESDFETLSADELAIKYPFDGLNVKHWKKLVGTEAEIQASITSTLPTASYAGFTPYKMIYELAEPIEDQHTPVILPTYYPTTVIEVVSNNTAELSQEITVKVEDEYL